MPYTASLVLFLSSTMKTNKHKNDSCLSLKTASTQTGLAAVFTAGTFPCPVASF